MPSAGPAPEPDAVAREGATADAVLQAATTDLSAQDVLAHLLRTHVAPALRELGFRGSGQVFELRDDTTWAVIGFVRSRYSRADELEFTINTVVIPKARWEQLRTQHPGLGRRPAPSDVRYARALRLDEVDDTITDPWWLVRPDSSPTGVAADVLDTVRRSVLPWVCQRLHPTAPPPHAASTVAGAAADRATFLV